MRKENINLAFEPFGPTNGEYYSMTFTEVNQVKQNIINNNNISTRKPSLLTSFPEMKERGTKFW